MEFPFSLSPLLHHASVSPSDVSEVGAHTLSAWSWPRIERLRDRHLQDVVFGAVVNDMGSRSASAQQLKQVITSLSKFAYSKDRIYLHCTLPSTVNAILRVGEKRLFIRDESATIKEITPSCVLDFYVSESRQRSGYGRQLFEFMLRQEASVSPARFGYDRPSPKLLAFLAKHYDLKSFVPQNNNFVVFRKYFAKDLPNKPWGHEDDPPREDRRAGTANDAYSSQQQQQYSSRHHPSSSHDASYPASSSSRQSREPASRADYSSFAHLQASPPPGQASFSHFDSSDSGRLLEYDDVPEPSSRSSRDTHLRSTASISSSYAPQPAPSPSSRSSHARAPSSAASTGIFPPPNTHFDDPNHPLGPSRLARAGSNMLSSTNLHHQSSSSAASSSRNTTSSAAAQAFQSPFSPPKSQHTLASTSSSDRDRSAYGVASSPTSRPPANFLPDGMSVASEVSVDRRAHRSGIQQRPLLDHSSTGLRQAADNIDRLEASIREKEAALAAPSRYAIPYRTPNERDAAWSRAASYQRVQRQGGEFDSSSAAGGSGSTSEHGAQYANPSLSSKVGGGAGPYAAANYITSSSNYGGGGRAAPFAYGSSGLRR